MARKWSVVLLTALLMVLPFGLATAGTLGMAPGPWALPMSDGELRGIRGGYFGFAFSLVFGGLIDDGSNVAGAITNDTGTVLEPPVEFSVKNGKTSVTTALGDFNGARGVFQINQVPGSFNVVHNNLFIQITLVTVQNSAGIPGLFSSLGLR